MATMGTVDRAIISTSEELLAAARPDNYFVREHDARQCLADSKDLAEAKKRMGRGLFGILKRPTDHKHSDDRWLRRITTRGR